MRVAGLACVAGGAALIAALSFVVVNNGVRALALGGVLALCAGVVVAATRVRALVVVVVAAVAAVVVACADDVDVDAAALDVALRDQALTFVDVPYVWGGEHDDGIDCSGLPRVARRRAALRFAWTHRDPALLRLAVVDWFVDVPAKGMLAGRGTVEVARARRTRDLPASARTPGTLIATADGQHMMVMVDATHVVEADPLPDRVVVLDVDDTNPWLAKPVVALRYRWE